MEISISEVLADNYLGIGATGIGVIGAVIDDLMNDRIDSEWIHGMGSSSDEVSQALTDLIVSVTPYLFAMRTPKGWVQA